MHFETVIFSEQDSWKSCRISGWNSGLHDTQHKILVIFIWKNVPLIYMIHLFSPQSSFPLQCSNLHISTTPNIIVGKLDITKLLIRFFFTSCWKIELWYFAEFKFERLGPPIVNDFLWLLVPSSFIQQQQQQQQQHSLPSNRLATLGEAKLRLYCYAYWSMILEFTLALWPLAFAKFL